MAKINSYFTAVLISFIRLYQAILSPFLGCHCRFFPSCSDYMIQAITTYGIFWGIYTGIKRLLKCQPFCQGGIDTVKPLHLFKRDRFS